MAKTTAQRQAAYRARRAYAGPDGNGERRVTTWLDTSTWLALDRLARRYAVTQRAMIAQLIRAEDDRILATIDPDSPDWREYFNDRLLLRNDDGHQGSEQRETVPSS
ncbi:hypothetical protein AWB78_08631 [Caballeronia calidae]|uniref:Uncharacterized protein n=1 Tax=Caballeronia calidae TaxID=1777139 RepID=A0A158EMG6_9BURK|nr:hypothetical protein [Caballeronia calidae]SAL07556.1 hypothetical protein AWB78_08631 [Caballeronia calidae]